MIIILIVIAICVSVFFRNDWKKCFYLLIFMVPFFGFIQLHISNLTVLASLIHDITLILPLYFLFIINRIKTTNVKFYLPGYFTNFVSFFVILRKSFLKFWM